MLSVNYIKAWGRGGEHGNARGWSSVSTGHLWSAAWFWDYSPIELNKNPYF